MTLVYAMGLVGSATTQRATFASSIGAGLMLSNDLATLASLHVLALVGVLSPL